MALASAALLGARADPQHIDWQPALAAAQPWRCISAVAVHYGVAHLAVNLIGAGVVAVLGWAARVDGPTVAAWVAAWPLAQLGLLADGSLDHYGGLSGVLHAGVAVVALHLVAGAGWRDRAIGAALLAGLLAKLALEFPWSPPRLDATLGIPVASSAHASGVVAGVVCAAIAWSLRRSQRTARAAQRNHGQ